MNHKYHKCPGVCNVPYKRAGYELEADATVIVEKSNAALEEMTTGNTYDEILAGFGQT